MTELIFRLCQRFKSLLQVFGIVVVFLFLLYLAVPIISDFIVNNPIAGASVTPELRQVMNETYGIGDLPSSVEIVGVNLRWARSDGVLFSHYIMSEDEWRYAESKFQQSFQPVEQYSIDGRCRWWGNVNLGPVDPNLVESAYELQDSGPGYTMVLQCYPIDGRYSVYMLANEEHLPDGIWDFF